MKINWFPGHMKKALQEMKKLLANIDALIYVLDCRAPISSINPSLNKLAEGKKILFVFNKFDLSDQERVKFLAKSFKKPNSDYVCLDSTMSGSSKIIKQKINNLCRDKLEKFKAKGLKTTIRALVVGVPNSGKSTLVNNLCGKAKAITGNKPAVTKLNQWVAIGDNIELCDTPGTLYPNLENQEIAKKLCLIGSIKDQIFDELELATELLKMLEEKYPSELANRFKEAKDLGEIAKNRGYLLGKGELDLSRAANAVIDDFRKGRIGRITLD